MPGATTGSKKGAPEECFYKYCFWHTFRAQSEPRRHRGGNVVLRLITLNDNGLNFSEGACTAFRDQLHRCEEQGEALSKVQQLECDTRCKQVGCVLKSELKTRSSRGLSGLGRMATFVQGIFASNYVRARRNIAFSCQHKVVEQRHTYRQIKSGRLPVASLDKSQG